jgi:pSer/pThr/pTyr-binding forkhead associated (FHA) protein
MTEVSGKTRAIVQSSSDAQAVTAAERSGRPFLVFRDGADRQQLFFFDPGAASITVGRSSSADLALGWDDRVSRLHALFEREEREDWVLVDDGKSSNGTYVNEERVSGRRRLTDGDVLRFGRTTVSYRSPAQRTPAAPEHRAPLRSSPPPAAVRSGGAVSLSTTQRRVLVALCRPYNERGTLATPAADEQIADEVVLSVSEVKRHIRVLYAKLGIEGPPGSETRVRLAERAFSAGIISARDL